MPLPATVPVPGPETTADRFALEALEFQSVRDLLLRFLVSPLGRPLVEQARPLEDLASVTAALAEVGEMAALLRRGERVPLSGFLDVRPWLASIVRESHIPEGKELADLRKVLASAGRVRKFFLALPEAGSPRLFALGAAAPDLEPLVLELERTVDAAGKVLATASPRLARLRDEVAQADAALHTAIERVLADPGLRKLLQTPGISWRNERPVVQVKLEWGRRVPGILHDRSQSGSTLFIEPEALVEKANELQNRRASEAREVQLVLVEAARKVRAELDRIEDCLLLLSRVDYCQARARLTTELGFTVPAIAEGGVLRLREARHPILLLARTPGEIVPLDLDLGDAYRLLVVTGPNTGGKTVTLKTVGLLAGMALSGIPVPAAAGTAFPMLDGVFVDIGDEQEIAQNLSTFSSHVQRIAGCLARATATSLVLLDELGAGTDPEEGAALGWAILEGLRERRCLTVASTHLGRLKEFAYQHEGVQNGSMAFDPATLAPRYRLEIGLPGTSNALHVARVMGLSEALVERARSLLGKRDSVVEDMIDSIQLTRMAAEEDRKRSEQTVRELAGARDQLRAEQEELELRRAWLREEADHLVDEELKAARSLLAIPLREFRNAPQPYGEKAKDLIEALDFILGRSPLARRRLKYIGTLKKGDIVYVPRYRRRCVVQKVDRTRERILVAMGDLRAEIAYEEVSWLQPLAE